MLLFYVSLLSLPQVDWSKRPSAETLLKDSFLEPAKAVLSLGEICC